MDSGIEAPLKGVPLSVVILTAIAVATLLTAAHRFLSIDYDSREPPLIKSKVPYIGHLIGLFKHGARYYDLVNRPYGHPIYTLPTPQVRQYIVTAPQLAALLQRSHKDLSFYNGILEITRRMTGLPQSIMTKLAYNVDGHLGRDVGLMPQMHDMFSNVLGRGQTLQDMTNAQLTTFSDMLNQIASAGSTQEFDLLRWLQDTFAEANIINLYGPENPFAIDSSLIRSFWDFESGLLGLTIDLLPSITTRKAFLGRERVVQGLVDFIRRGSHKRASQVIQNRVRMNMEHGFNVEEAGRSELVLLFAILGNAVPSTFWVVLDIFSRPELLCEIRNELAKAVDTDGSGNRTIDVAIIKSSCPLFVSSYRESLRLIGNLASIRLVMRDTIIGKQYLKGNSLIQVAGCVVHQDPKTWGADSREFNPRRFMNSSTAAENTEALTEADAQESTATQLPPGVPGAAYRLFGGGSVICPGRHFAQSEILGFVAYLIIAFDISASDGSVLTLPEKDVDSIPLTVLKPKKDARVRIRRRKGLENAELFLNA
jgi:cytochrome P450